MKVEILALLDYDIDGISISFPQLKGAFSCAYSEEEVYSMAKECAELHLSDCRIDEIYDILDKDIYIELGNGQVLKNIICDLYV